MEFICVSRYMAIYCSILLEHMRARTAWPGTAGLPAHQRGRFAASLRDNRAILNHGKTFYCFILSASGWEGFTSRALDLLQFH